MNEDYNIASTPAPNGICDFCKFMIFEPVLWCHWCSRKLRWSPCFSSELQASTPAIGVHNDVGDDEDEDEPPLNENDDDDDDLDDVDKGEELNTQHLVLAQFDKVTVASGWQWLSALELSCFV